MVWLAFLGCRRLLTIPGIGPLTATALTAAIGNGAAFRKSRDLASWLGLVPRQEWNASMGELSASTVNIRLSAARKLVEEARRNDLLSAEAALGRRSQAN